MLLHLNLLDDISFHYLHHSSVSSWYQEKALWLQKEFQECFKEQVANISLGSTGPMVVRNIDFGSVTSRDLFGLDEIIIFAWYEINRKRYKRVLDLGRNVGVHSIIMEKLGFDVTSYEPDDVHIAHFKQTLFDNNSKQIELRERAIGVSKGTFEFTRVLGNTTSSHLSGSKREPYGHLTSIEVSVDSILDVLNEGFDFCKMDVEGIEADLIGSMSASNFITLEIMLEVGSSENAFRIHQQLERLEINAFSQKNGWGKVLALNDVPTSHREGSLFLTRSSSMNWQL